MKKFTKICIVFAGTALFLGLIFNRISYTIFGWDGNLELFPNAAEELENRVERLVHRVDEVEAQFDRGAERDTEPAAADEAQLQEMIDGTDRVPAGKDFSESYGTDITELEIDVTYADVRILPSEDDQIYVKADQLHNSFRVESEQEDHGRKLKIEDERKERSARNGNHLILDIYLPERQLKEIDVDMGVGLFRTEYAWTRDFKLENGVAKCMLSQLQTEYLELGNGVGEITATVKGSLPKGADIECGVGEITLTLEGRQEDYNFSIQDGIGTVRIGDTEYNGVFGYQQSENHSGKPSIEMMGGVGAITVEFTDPAES